MLNAITIDLEDWAQAVLDPALPVTDCVLANTDRILQFLDRYRVKATFFALGRVCEQFPSLLPMIASEGHEVASHGYGHQLVYHLSPEEFEADVRLSAELINAQIGRAPLGYRAPAFSITRHSLWAGPILAKLGFRYSSSIFPINKQRYGIREWPVAPEKWPVCDLIEFPLTTLSVAGMRIPMCGGGYTRLWPSRLHALAIARRNAAGCSAVVYVHPYELAQDEVRWFMRSGVRVGWRRAFMQSLWRSRVEPRLRVLLDRFAFGTMSDALAEMMPGWLSQPSQTQAAGVDDRRKSTRQQLVPV